MLKISIPGLILFSLLFTVQAQAQTWVPGYFYGVQGNKETGLIKFKTSARGPVKGEAFIEFKEDAKAKPIPLSASDLSSFVMGRDSFVVAAAPRMGAWSNNELDFVKVVLDEDLKLYMFRGGSSGGGGIQPDLGIGIGGGFGGGIGGGISIPLGGGNRNKITYYFGANTAEMKVLTPANFIDVMAQIMGDEPDVVDALHQGKYNLGNMDKLIAYFDKLQEGNN